MERFDESHSGDSCWMWSAWPAGRFQYWSLVQGQLADERPRRVRRERPAVDGERWARPGITRLMLRAKRVGGTGTAPRRGRGRDSDGRRRAARVRGPGRPPGPAP